MNPALEFWMADYVLKMAGDNRYGTSCKVSIPRRRGVVATSTTTILSEISVWESRERDVMTIGERRGRGLGHGNPREFVLYAKVPIHDLHIEPARQRHRLGAPAPTLRIPVYSITRSNNLLHYLGRGPVHVLCYVTTCDVGDAGGAWRGLGRKMSERARVRKGVGVRSYSEHRGRGVQRLRVGDRDGGAACKPPPPPRGNAWAEGHRSRAASARAPEEFHHRTPGKSLSGKDYASPVDSPCGECEGFFPSWYIARKS
ncbi:hypothetical protein H4582DRAFT_2051236 [Lactarius indigo]|nr:hypothetical protein H4582DRAFT_2051236 [Lactarius indigo]